MSVNSKLVSKSIESILLAIELYNKPLITYRTDAVIVLLINSWESLLKALILKNKWAKISINNEKKFLECVECVHSNLGKSYPDDWYASIKILYDERCKIIHFNKDLILIDYMLIQSNILLFKKFAETLLDKDVTKKVGWMVMPLGFDVPYTEFDFLNNKTTVSKSSLSVRNFFEKMSFFHNEQLAKGSNGILLNVDITMQNVNRIDSADFVVGIKKESDINFNYTNSVKLTNTGRETRIKEITDALSVYYLHYKQVMKECKKIEGHTQEKLNDFMKKIGKSNESISFDWSKFSHIFPMKITKKYTFSDIIYSEYKKYIRKKIS